MSVIHELQMKQWQAALDTIFQHIDGPDSVLSHRAKNIKKRLKGSYQGSNGVVAEWLACDESHTSYIAAHETGDTPAWPTIDQLKLLTIGSCTCMTKSHLPEHHDEQCRYRVLEEAIALLE